MQTIDNLILFYLQTAILPIRFLIYLNTHTHTHKMNTNFIRIACLNYFQADAVKYVDCQQLRVFK